MSNIQLTEATLTQHSIQYQNMYDAETDINADTDSDSNSTSSSMPSLVYLYNSDDCDAYGYIHCIIYITAHHYVITYIDGSEVIYID